MTTRIYQNSKYKHPALSTSCRASRRPGFFIWNIFLVMVSSAHITQSVTKVVVYLFSGRTTSFYFLQSNGILWVSTNLTSVRCAAAFSVKITARYYTHIATVYRFVVWNYLNICITHRKCKLEVFPLNK